MKKDNTDIQIERVYKEIRKVEPDITSLLKKLSKKYGGKLSGIDQKFKKENKENKEENEKENITVLFQTRRGFIWISKFDNCLVVV